MATDTGSTPSLEAGAELERTLDRLEARMAALQFSLRVHCGSSRFALWQPDLPARRQTGFRLVARHGQDPALEGS